MQDIKHYSVLLETIMSYFDKTKSNQAVLDCTAGAGGYIDYLIANNDKNIKSYTLLDYDPGVVEFLKSKYSNNKKVNVICLNFKDLKSLKEQYDFVIFDLGLNNTQIKDKNRGFSFRDSSLDLRLNREEQHTTGLDLINTLSKSQLTELFMFYGEFNGAKKLAETIVSKRQSGEITAVEFSRIARVVLSPMHRKKIDVLTLPIQALRIALNDELNSLNQALTDIGGRLNLGAILAVISFHSLEDRIVKHKFKTYLNNGYQNLTKSFVLGSDVDNNPNARSAKLRVIKK
jgi:16S rRNA (cytosine1402-N4)-methyltransferase